MRTPSRPPPSAPAASRAASLAPRYDARLIEEIVTRELRRRSATGETDALARYHGTREGLYAHAGAERERAFARLHRERFRDLGFEAPIAAVVSSHADALGGLPALTIERATHADDEAADLGEPGDAGRPGVVRIAVARFFDGTLLPFLDHELTHLADLVDPAFAHDPAALDRVAVHRKRTMQLRYRLAWAASVDGRLARAGRSPLVERHEHERRLAPAYAPLPPPAIREIVQRLWAGPRATHRDLLDLATMIPARSERTEGAPCPLCTFPTYRWAPEPTPAMCEAIARDVPGWRADDGLCDRCFEAVEGRATAAHRD